MRTFALMLLACICLVGTAQAQSFPTQGQIEQMRRPPPQANERYYEQRHRRESTEERIEREDAYRQRLGPCGLYGTCPEPSQPDRRER